MKIRIWYFWYREVVPEWMVLEATVVDLQDCRYVIHSVHFQEPLLEIIKMLPQTIAFKNTISEFTIFR